MNGLAQILTHAVPSGFGNRVQSFPRVVGVTQRMGPMLTSRAGKSSSLRRQDDIQELDRVRLLADVMTPDGVLTSGTQGTAVYRYRDGVAFEVEFHAPIQVLLTLRPDEIARADEIADFHA